jgi:hypothetical protein
LELAVKEIVCELGGLVAPEGIRRHGISTHTLSCGAVTLDSYRPEEGATQQEDLFHQLSVLEAG